eukprot:2028950-Rhodomonas_salina.4
MLPDNHGLAEKRSEVLGPYAPATPSLCCKVSWYWPRASRGTDLERTAVPERRWYKTMSSQRMR